MSLLGAVAYLAHTRVDALVFISALQRFNSKPTVVHVKRLNKLLRWLQAHPKKLAYKQLTGGGRTFPKTSSHLRVVSDAAFKREGEATRFAEPCSFGQEVRMKNHTKRPILCISWSGCAKAKGTWPAALSQPNSFRQAML